VTDQFGFGVECHKACETQLKGAFASVSKQISRDTEVFFGASAIYFRILNQVQKHMIPSILLL